MTEKEKNNISQKYMLIPTPKAPKANRPKAPKLPC